MLELTNLTKQQAEFINSMANSITTFEKYFNSMISYSRLLIEDKDYREEIILSDFLEELSYEVENIMMTENINFEMTNMVASQYFRGNRFNLGRALINILANATRYSSEDKKVILSVKEQADCIIFEIWNNGLPFSDYSLKNATKLFYTENKGRNNKHYGVGLAFAKQVANKHQGDLILSNPNRGGAQVTLIIKK